MTRSRVIIFNASRCDPSSLQMQTLYFNISNMVDGNITSPFIFNNYMYTININFQLILHLIQINDMHGENSDMINCIKFVSGF